jgi:hypothetical protein
VLAGGDGEGVEGGVDRGRGGQGRAAPGQQPDEAALGWSATAGTLVTPTTEKYLQRLLRKEVSAVYR